MPKRGFNNKRFRTEYNIVNVESLNAFADGETVNQEALLKKRILAKQMKGLKILGNGELKIKLTVEAESFSQSAREKIEKLNGICKVIN